MIEFVNTTDADFEELDRMLDDDQCHVFSDRVLPKGCTPGRANIGFEKDRGIYTVLIDEGIQTDIDDDAFRSWLRKGEVRLTSIQDLAAFFRSMRPLFDDASENSPIVDKKKVQEIADNGAGKKTVLPNDISDRLKRDIFGQDEAVDKLSEGIALSLMNREEKVYAALLMGPPATGKTETASLLPGILTDITGHEYGFIKIDANTYGQEHMVQNLLGAPAGYIGYKDETKLDPVRKNPYQVILFDEIEKACDKLLVALMGALDKGMLTMADNSPAIDLNRCVILFTSNIPIDVDAYRRASEWERDEMCKDVFTANCGRPEISRRIKDFMVYDRLSEEARVDVLVKFASRKLSEYDARLVHIDEQLMAEFIKSETRYGSSELAYRMERAIGRAHMKALKENRADIIRGKTVALGGSPDNMTIDILTEAV